MSCRFKIQLSEGTAIGDELITVVADDSDYGSDGVVTYTITGKHEFLAY